MHINLTVDQLIDYFAQLKGHVDIQDFHDHVFQTCAQNFLSGEQRADLKELIENLPASLEHWDKKHLPKLNNPSLSDDCRADWLEDRESLKVADVSSYAIRNILKNLNSRRRREWIIEYKRFEEETSALLLSKISNITTTA